MKNLNDYFFLFHLRPKYQYFILIILIIISVLLEMLGIGLVVPLLQVLTNSETIENLSKFLFKNFGYNIISSQHLTDLILKFLVLIYLIKSFFSLLLNWSINKFTYGTEAQICKNLYESFLYKPYKFHLDQNNSKILQNFIIDSQVLSFHFILPFFKLLAESFIFVGLSMVLIIYNPISTLYVFSIGLLFIIIYWLFSKKFITRWGIKRENLDGRRIKHLQNSLLAIKEVKTSNLEKYFLKKFNDLNFNLAKYNRYQNTGLALPQIILELFVVCLISIYLLFFSLPGDEMRSIIPTLGLYVAVAVRSMPTINRIIVALQQIKFASPVVPRIVDALKMKNYKNISVNYEKNIDVDFKIMQFKNINFDYANKKVIQELNLKISKGDIIGITGNSGSGKTTFLNIFLGLLEPKSGEVYADNIKVKSFFQQYKGKILYLSQNISLFDENVAFNISLQSDKVNDLVEDNFKNAIKNSDLDFLKNHNGEIEKDLKLGDGGIRISGGQRQKIAIARAHYFRPDILILDETTNSLDSDAERKILNTLIKSKKFQIVFIVSHHKRSFEYCNKMFDIENMSIK